MRKIVESDLVSDVFFREETAVNSALILHEGPASIRERAVGFRRYTHNEVGGVDIRLHLGASLSDAFLDGTVDLSQLFDFRVQIPLDAAVSTAVLRKERTDRRVFLIDGPIITRNDVNQRRGFTRN